jgi:hypothetical protein
MLNGSVLVAKFRIIKQGTRNLEPIWYIEKFGWTIFGKQWCQCSPYFESQFAVNNYFSCLEHKEKLKSYKEIVLEKEI